MAQKNSMASINFSSYVTERTEYFVGREWAFTVIDNWLADPDGPRFLLITGEPGSGKTAFAARLFQISQKTVSPPVGLLHLTPQFISAAYFCSARDKRWIDPRTFAESLALQLATRYPAYAEALTEKSGDRPIHIEPHISIERAEGLVQGVVINSINASGCPPEDAFNRVVREPLEALYQSGFDQPVIILVDALDEALGYGMSNIVSLLAQTEYLPARVRFLLTSRQDARVVNKFRDASEFVLSAPEYDQHNQNDIRHYVQDRLSGDAELVARAAQVEPQCVTGMVEIVPRKAEGNFLYARFLLDAIAKGLRSLTKLEGLPEGLDELYYDSLERVVELGKRDWFREYALLMGTLSVAQESLTLAQLQALTGLPRSSCMEYRRNLQQFIEEVKPQGENKELEPKYRLYHQSVSDFLGHEFYSVSNTQKENIFCLPADEWHKNLAERCEQGGISSIWGDARRDPVEQGRREYGRLHYVTHLYHAQEWEKLFTVLDDRSYGKAKIQYDPSMRSYAMDLNWGRQAAASASWGIEQGIRYLAHLWRYTLLQCSLTVRAYQYPEAAFALMMRLGYEAKAIGLAELITDSREKVERFMMIAANLIRQPGRETDGIHMFLRAHDVISRIAVESQRVDALMSLATFRWSPS